ncbi:hypothetical protein [Pseudomonas mosselii]|uniref:hypothetical protein n=1 Tax=Pseudomonas mosselii TaxID=78327 RepID=UPI003F2C62C4
MEIITLKSRLSKSLNSVQDWVTEKHPYIPEDLETYMSGTANLVLACNDLFRLGLLEIKKSLFCAAHHTTAYSSLITGLTRMIACDAILIERLKNTQQSDTSTLDDLTQLMLCAAATGQYKLLGVLHSTVIKALSQGYGVEDGHNLPIGTTLRYAAFGLTIIGNWLEKPLDLDKHALPRDPTWGQLVAHWREPDSDKFLPIVMAACDTHIDRIALTSRELDSGDFEFSSPFQAVYPAEILAILNLRRSLGLTNPFIDHPLMTTPYAKLTCPPGTRLERDELLERFMAAVYKYDPQAMPKGLYQAVMHTIEEP